jgi:hypothetical protein
VSARRNRMNKIADQIAICGLRSSVTAYQRAKDTPATAPSTHWDLLISATSHSVKATYRGT